MCGIAGFLEMSSGLSAEALHEMVRGMAATMIRRGPDDSDTWADAKAGVALGFRRLAIIDLTPAGRQPMASVTGRYMIVFNGEVYNFGDLRRELEISGACPVLRGSSDTEIMLACIEAWGMKAAVGRFVGMFAFALWDRQERVLHLVRDRIGVKPLYYGWAGKSFVFGSELKALRAHPEFAAEVDRDALTLMMRYGYVPAPYSIYKGINKLPAGSLITIRSGCRAEPTPCIYWSTKEVAQRGIANPFTGSDTDAIEELDALLRESVKLRMISDVPLGVFLSGGIDSSLVTALMQVQSPVTIKTFTIGFEEAAYNEAPNAKAVASHLNTDHTELTVLAKDAMAVIPRLPSIFDEPFADASQIPTLLVSELARRQVTVSLSGDGGDELFAGYSRHLWGQRVWNRINGVPLSLRRTTSRAIKSISPRAWGSMFNSINNVLPNRALQRNPGDKMAKLADTLVADSPEAMYALLVSRWKRPESIVLNAMADPIVWKASTEWGNISDFTSQMLYMDTVSYLPDDILVKVDRSSMSVSLESREPLLDHRVLEYAWSLPLHMKLRNGQGKWILRQVLHRYVPEAIVDRPKAGFGVPIDAWLRGPLRDWAEDLLSEALLRRQGYLDTEPVRAVWHEHIAGRQNNDAMLWNVLMFQAWETNR